MDFGKYSNLRKLATLRRHNPEQFAEVSRTLEAYQSARDGNPLFDSAMDGMIGQIVVDGADKIKRTGDFTIDSGDIYEVTEALREATTAELHPSIDEFDTSFIGRLAGQKAVAPTDLTNNVLSKYQEAPTLKDKAKLYLDTELKNYAQDAIEKKQQFLADQQELEQSMWDIVDRENPTTIEPNEVLTNNTEMSASEVAIDVANQPKALAPAKGVGPQPASHIRASADVEASTDTSQLNIDEPIILDSTKTSVEPNIEPPTASPVAPKSPNNSTPPPSPQTGAPETPDTTLSSPEQGKDFVKLGIGAAGLAGGIAFSKRAIDLRNEQKQEAQHRDLTFSDHAKVGACVLAAVGSTIAGVAAMKAGWQGTVTSGANVSQGASL